MNKILILLSLVLMCNLLIGCDSYSNEKCNAESIKIMGEFSGLVMTLNSDNNLSESDKDSLITPVMILSTFMEKNQKEYKYTCSDYDILKENFEKIKKISNQKTLTDKHGRPLL